MLLLWVTRPEHARFYCGLGWIKRAFRRGDWRRAERYAREYLARAERFHWDWNYGNAIHDGNQYLGLIQLRRGDVDGAK
jgi:hypothetical protein